MITLAEDYPNSKLDFVLVQERRETGQEERILKDGKQRTCIPRRQKSRLILVNLVPKLVAETPKPSASEIFTRS
jgi:hypothetical protein